MKMERLMDELIQNPFWGIDNVKTPDPGLLDDFVSAYRLPEDYIKLLSITDGFVLFHAGDYAVYDMELVRLLKSEPKYSLGIREEILIVGYFMEYELVLNQNESDTDSYLYAGFSASADEYVRIGTMTDFLEGLIQAKGEIPFWEIKGQEQFRFFD